MQSLQQVIDLDDQFYMNTFGPRPSVFFTHGEGAVLYDQNNKPYYDFLAGIATVSLGHSHPAVTETIKNQAGKVMHYSNYFYNEYQAKLAGLLCEVSCAKKVFITNTGAEANEGAIKLARKYFYKKGEEKYEVISANNSFHGRTLATVALTGQEKYQTPYRPLPPGIINVDYNNLKAIKEAVTDKTCAIMLETIQGEGGIIECSQKYLWDVRALCDDLGIMLIIDEIQTGLCRTGKMFSYAHFDFLPDIFTSAKALGNGFPVAAVLARGPVADAFEPGDHGSTFGGNVLACATAVTVIETMLKENLAEKAEETGEYFKSKLRDLSLGHKNIAKVRGRGLMLGLELTPDTEAKKIVAAALERGFIFNAAGNNTLRFVPPLIIGTDIIDLAVDLLDELL